MATFNTVPEEEPLVEKATTKTPWRRLVGSAAIASLILGVVAATALSSAASGPSPTGTQTTLKSSHKSSHKKLGSTGGAPTYGLPAKCAITVSRETGNLH